MKALFLLILLLSLLGACGDGGGGTGNDSEPAPPLTGIEWRWQQTLSGDGSTLVPADPASYTLTFRDDGKIAARVDCNQAGGTYTLKNGQLKIDITHSTQAMCPPDSLDRDFLRQLDAVAIYFLRNGNLYLDMKMDSGTMKFSPEQLF